MTVAEMMIEKLNRCEHVVTYELLQVPPRAPVVGELRYIIPLVPSPAEPLSQLWPSEPVKIIYDGAKWWVAVLLLFVLLPMAADARECRGLVTSNNSCIGSESNVESYRNHEPFYTHERSRNHEISRWNGSASLGRDHGLHRRR